MIDNEIKQSRKHMFYIFIYVKKYISLQRNLLTILVYFVVSALLFEHL